MKETTKNEFTKLLIRLWKISFNSWIRLASSLKKTDVTLELSTNIDMLLMVEKVNTDGIYNSVNKYVKVNNKYMKDYNKHKESSYLKYWL